MTKAQLQEKVEELEAQVSRLKNPQTDDDKAEMISICAKTIAAQCTAMILTFQLGPDYEAQTTIDGNILACEAMAYKTESDVAGLISSGFQADPEFEASIQDEDDEPYKDSDDDED